VKSSLNIFIDIQAPENLALAIKSLLIKAKLSQYCRQSEMNEKIKKVIL
jgi:hypothetical protein